MAELGSKELPVHRVMQVLHGLVLIAWVFGLDISGQNLSQVRVPQSHVMLRLICCFMLANVIALAITLAFSCYTAVMLRRRGYFERPRLSRHHASRRSSLCAFTVLAIVTLYIAFTLSYPKAIPMLRGEAPPFSQSTFVAGAASSLSGFALCFASSFCSFAALSISSAMEHRSRMSVVEEAALDAS